MAIRFQELTWAPSGTWSWSWVIGEDPVLLIVMVTRPPPLHEEETAKEVPALQVPVDPLDGVGLTPLLPDELEVEVEGVELDEEELEELAWLEEEELAEELAWLEEEELEEEEELDEEEELAELETESPESQFCWVAHWQVAASEQDGEPPPPQGTWR